MTRKYTIKDIAEIAGVSKGTVDRVLHKRGKVSKKALEKVGEKTPLTIVLGLKSDLGSLYNDIGEYQLAETVLLESIQQIRQILGNKNIELSTVLNQISGTYRKLGQMDKAKDAVTEAYHINLEVFGENNVNTAISLNMLGVMSYQTGDVSTAISHMRKAIEIFDKSDWK